MKMEIIAHKCGQSINSLKPSVFLKFLFTLKLTPNIQIQTGWSKQSEYHLQIPFE